MANKGLKWDNCRAFVRVPPPCPPVPRWGNERVQEVMRTLCDTYAHLNNGVLRLANQDATINEIQNVYEVPESP